jgi:serine/threonine-protein kinase
MMSLSHSMPAAPPKRRFRKVRRLGGGGMGVVYLARDTVTGRHVALKTAGAGDWDIAALCFESRALAAIDHPNVIGLWAADALDGMPYYVMPYIAGGTLARWLAASRPATAVLDMFIAAGAGLAAVHAAGFVHGDFKADNVLISDDGRPLLCDFGAATYTSVRADTHADAALARSVHELSCEVVDAPLTARPTRGELSSVLGTPAYVAPERYFDWDGDPRSDQYSFCTALFEALHHRLPYAGATRREVVRSAARGARAGDGSSAVSAAVGAVLTRGLSPLPWDRFDDMDALIAALAAARS